MLLAKLPSEPAPAFSCHSWDFCHTFVLEQGFPSCLPFSCIIFRRPEFKWKHAAQYCLIRFYLINISVQETVILLYVVCILSFCSYQNVDIWYIAVLFFTCVAFFLRSQNISTLGLGQRTKPEGSENPCVRIRPFETSKN